MGTGGTRKANSPRGSETVFNFFGLPSVSGVISTSAPGSANPGGRKTVPPITEKAAEASLPFFGFFSAAAGATDRIRPASTRQASLLPVVVLVFVILFFVIIGVAVLVLILVFFFLFIDGRFDFD